MPPSQPIRATRGVRDILPKERAVWRTAEEAAALVSHLREDPLAGQGVVQEHDPPVRSPADGRAAMGHLGRGDL